MPIISTDYQPPQFLHNGHALTLWSFIWRKVASVPYTRVSIPTFDGDSIDVDMCFSGEKRHKIAILSHGLEGNSQRRYMRGMAHKLLACGWDVALRNLRMCSGRMGRTPKHYHMGATDDLHSTVMYCLEQGYDAIALIGFSMGGSQTLTYLGREADSVPAQVTAAVGVSVPCDLVVSAAQLDMPMCLPYTWYFMRTLKEKMRRAAALYTDFPSIRDIDSLRTFAAFDSRFTAPINGFASADDYWTRSSCGQYLEQIRVPTLVLNAQDDPFMAGACYPVTQAQNNPCLYLAMPEHGGHVGFVTSVGTYWSEEQAAVFLQEHGTARA